MKFLCPYPITNIKIFYIVLSHSLIATGLALLHLAGRNEALLAAGHIILCFGIFFIHMIPRLPFMTNCGQPKKKVDESQTECYRAYRAVCPHKMKIIQLITVYVGHIGVFVGIFLLHNVRRSSVNLIIGHILFCVGVFALHLLPRLKCGKK